MRKISTLTKFAATAGIAGTMSLVSFGIAGAATTPAIVKAPSCPAAEAQLQSDVAALQALFAPGVQKAESGVTAADAVAQVQQEATLARLPHATIRVIVTDVEAVIRDENAVEQACAPARLRVPTTPVTLASK
jgi:hypothetical protein